MEQENKNTITYDENWQSVSESEYPEIVSADEYGDRKTAEDRNKQKKHFQNENRSRHYLITVQLIVCLLIAAAAFVLKSSGTDLYQTVRDWYYTNLNNSVIFDNSEQIDLKSFFTSTADEAKN